MIVGCRGTTNINPRFLMAPEAMIKGVALASSTAQDYSRMGAAIVGGIEAGWVNPVIDKEYKMEEVKQVHHDIMNSSGAKGKLVLKIQE